VSVSPVLDYDFQPRPSFGQDTGPEGVARACNSSPGARHRSTTSEKGVRGAFWEDRYHATAIEIDEYLHRCCGLH
jgi:putative transposase